MVSFALGYLLYGVLPGYVVLRLASHRRHTVTPSEFLVWSALSHPLMAFIVLAFRLLGRSTALASRLIDALLLLLLCVLIFRLFPSRRKEAGKCEIQWDLLLSLAGILLLFFPMLGVRNWFAYHGFWQSATVDSLLAGKFPPENPGFAGETLPYVWLYNLWVSFMVVKTGVHSVLVNLARNIHLLMSLLGLSTLMAKAWGYDSSKRVWGFWLLLGSINIGAFVHLAPHIAVWLASSEGLLHSYESHAAGTPQPLLTLTDSILGIPVFHKAWSFLIKFMNFAPMVHGIIFFFLFAWSLNCLFEKEQSIRAWLTYALALLGLLLFYPVYVLFAILFALLYVVFSFLKDRNRIGFLPVKCVVLSALICALCLPYFLLIGSSPASTGVSVFTYLSSSLKPIWLYAVGPFWPLIPLVIYWIFKMRPKEQNVGKVAFLSAGLLTSALAPVLLTIAGGPANYKYVYLAALFVTWASYSVLMAKDRYNEKPWQRLRAVYTILAMGPIMLTVVGWSLGSWFGDEHFSIVGRDVKYRETEAGSEAIEWIAKHAEKGAVLLIPLTQADNKAGTTYALAALTGRPVYVVNDRAWVGGYPGYGDRIALAEQIWGARRVVPGTTHLDPALNGRSLYLIYSEDVRVNTDFYGQLLGPIQNLEFFPGSNMKEHVESLGFGTRQVYDEDGFTVLALTP